MTSSLSITGLFRASDVILPSQLLIAWVCNKKLTDSNPDTAKPLNYCICRRNHHLIAWFGTASILQSKTLPTLAVPHPIRLLHASYWIELPLTLLAQVLRFQSLVVIKDKTICVPGGNPSTVCTNVSIISMNILLEVKRWAKSNEQRKTMTYTVGISETAHFSTVGGRKAPSRREQPSPLCAR